MDHRMEATKDIIRGLVSGELVLLGQSRSISEFGNGEITAHFAIRTLLGERSFKAQAMTIRDVFDGMTEEQKYAMYALIGHAIENEHRITTIKRVVFNDPATIVFWEDGTKTVVKCGENDIFDPEKGLAMAIAKKALGNEGNYYNAIKKWLPKPEEDSTDDYILDAIEKCAEKLSKIANGFLFDPVDPND